MNPRPLTSLALALCASLLSAQRPAPAAQAAPGAPAPARPGGAPAPEANEPKPYDKVITPEAKSQEGFIKVHQLKGKVYFEIPKARLEQEQLLVVTANRVPANINHAGQVVDSDVVRWVLKENRLLLQQVSHAIVADPAKPVAKAVAANNTDTILMSFPVEAFAKDGSPVIEATKLFTSEVPEYSARQVLGAQMFDPSRSYVDKVKVFPENLNVEAVQTYSVPFSPAGAPSPSPFGTPTLRPGTSGTVTMFYSFLQLPEKPMLPRVFDERLGFFSVRNTDYGRDEHEAMRRTYITRWRLEKKDPAAALSEPVKPIVFYIDAATPAAWVPFIKKGVEAWQPAFEAAGFKNAILAKPAPTKEQDPDFDAGDARYSVIRWVPSPVANAYGPHISDPRSGEILEADIVLYHNILQLQRDWYFTQVAPLDKRAQSLPLPDDLMGELLAYVVTHEVGHSLGFPHNFKASSQYPFEKIRDKAWVKKMGHVSTLMDYSRFNYVAQPEDGFDPADLIPKIGPYDIFAVKWGYTPIPDAKTSDDEKARLNEWLKVQETEPWLRFSTAGAAGVDPGEETEAVGDADPVKATALGTKNLQRVLGLLPKASLKPGEDFREFGHLYEAIWGQWRRELGHVANLVGGFDTVNKHAGQSGGRFSPIAKARQAEAVKYLNGAIFKTPTWLLDHATLAKLEAGSGQVRLLAAQKGVLSTLLDHARLSRLEEQEGLLAEKAYTASQLLLDLRGGIFTELQSGAKVDPYRRNLQRAALDQLGALLNSAPTPQIASGGLGMAILQPNLSDDTRGAVRAELKALQALASRPNPDKATKAHLDDLKDQIARILDPKFLANAAGPAGVAAGRRIEDSCWPGVADVLE
ncbi:zinc-dependent metalloprotease [Geothrix sp. PMB-07]|uniref:zinc-dependent metalloprotease n=1 Tax=Geothrix sp. PMB-07 TaxID=3068640 RepID=UPI0027429793|nr:zinc-dependent metalloprotease [Geothrix sp. PMB-07]WLT32607.1 zinc-dependent metalloprotease [Geothrix sp. PMB-07]